MPWLVEKIVETRTAPSCSSGKDFLLRPIADCFHTYKHM